MKSFEITSQTKNVNFTYKNDEIVVIGNYQLNATTDTLVNISGSVYTKNTDGNQGDYIGNFNGNMRDGVMMYSFSEMSISNLKKVDDAIIDIEAEIAKDAE